MADDTHLFGGEHTVLKLAVLQDYLPAYTQALKNQPFRLSYIDAFAGTGSVSVSVRGEMKDIDGSARIALDCRPPFHRIVFIDTKLRHTQALSRLKETATGREVEVIRADANDELPKLLTGLDQKKDRAVVFLDPYGMSVNWATLEAVARTKLVDLWYLFPLSGLYRNAPNDAKAISDEKAAALQRMLGTDEWRADFYATSPQLDMFGGQPDEVRTSDVAALTRWVTGRLREIFPAVLEPKILYQTTASGRNGSPLFALYFAIANPSDKACGLAMKFAKHVLRD